VSWLKKEVLQQELEWLLLHVQALLVLVSQALLVLVLQALLVLVSQALLVLMVSMAEEAVVVLPPLALRLIRYWVLHVVSALLEMVVLMSAQRMAVLVSALLEMAQMPSPTWPAPSA